MKYYLPAILVLTACAQSPGAIDPVFNNPERFEALNCSELRTQSHALRNLEAELTADQNSARAADAIVSAFILVTPTLLNGDPNAASLATVKGDRIAVNALMSKRGCKGMAI